MKTVAAIILCLIISGDCISQNITNTIGVNGLFTVKDGSQKFLEVKQNTGQIDLLKNMKLEISTDSTKGVILKDGKRFIHDFKPGLSLGGNIFIGMNAGNFTMNASSSYLASSNTSLGNYTLNSLTNGYNNTAVGSESQRFTEYASNNSSFGFYSMWKNVSGSLNSAYGSNSMQENVSGLGNSAFGYGSLRLNVSGANNSAFGYNSLKSILAGYSNTAIGSHSLLSALGNRNTALGDSAGRTLTTGTNNTFIGFNSLPSSATVSNQIVLGNNQITSLRCNVQSITSLSDARDKKQIEDLSLGLEFILKLKPRQFKWDKREWYEDGANDGNKMAENFTAGFIAQELDSVQSAEDADWLGLVLKDNPEKMEATYGNLLPVIVKAIQEMKEMNDDLRSANTALAEEINSLRKEISEMNLTVETKAGGSGDED